MNKQKQNSWQMRDGVVIPLEDIRAVYLSENDMAAIALKDGSTRLTNIPFGKAVQQLGVFNEDQNISKAWQTNITFAYLFAYIFLITAFIWGIYSFVYVGAFYLLLRTLPMFFFLGLATSQSTQWAQARSLKSISSDKSEWNRATALFYLNKRILSYALLLGLLAIVPLGDPVTTLIAAATLIILALFWFFRLKKERSDLLKFNEEKFMQADSDAGQLLTAEQG
jgi:hypothetical protein